MNFFLVNNLISEKNFYKQNRFPWVFFSISHLFDLYNDKLVDNLFLCYIL